MKSAEIRRSFLDFFVAHGHTEVASSSILIKDDPTLLFTNAGMNQFKSVFLGSEKRPYSRATTSQKCFRVSGKHNDLENVGQTSRHHTFFEMLGNFSFGNYFKADAIAYGWEWVTKTLGLPKDRLYTTVYTDDDEAFALWEKIDPALKGRVLRFGQKENYWSMGDVGPCGPCTEIHYDRGAQYSCGRPECSVNCECDRYLELWNLVFMQFSRAADGTISPLPKPSVDTGGGLERFAAVLQDTPSNYETDLFMPLINQVEKLSGITYTPGAGGMSHRVAADHIRALGFAIADGGLPSNDGAGYVLRRILRRAARHGKVLGLEKPYLYQLVPPLVKLMGPVYPDLSARQEHITTVIKSEEERFAETLDAGLAQFERIREQLKKSNTNVISGKDVFKLFDTYGFPLDLTEVMAREEGLTVDLAGYQAALDEQRTRSRQASTFAVDLTVPQECREAGPTEFVYDSFEITATVLWASDQQGAVVLDRTPFYAESGGQVDDLGVIECENCRFVIEHMNKRGDTVFHLGRFELGDAAELCGKTVIARIDERRRRSIMRNHTATHLLHRALRDVLGEHVHQAGSLVEPERLRFDFSHFKPPEPDELLRVEQQVNAHILANTALVTDHTSYDIAVKSGAMALFGEKYGDEVRVVKIGNVSAELCGGTHVKSTGEIGQLRIIAETGVAAGVRRIEAITGEQAYKQAVYHEEMIHQAAQLLGTAPDKAPDRLQERLEEIRRLQQENKKLRERLMAGASAGPMPSARDFDGKTLHLLYEKIPDYSADDLIALADRWQKENAPTIIFLANDAGILVSAANQAAIKLGAHAGNLMKATAGALGGGGGGKPNFAQGKGKNLSEWDKTKDRWMAAIAEMVK
jgi:alanyl-tRNA synthetase